LVFCDCMWALQRGGGKIAAQARRRRRCSMKKYIGCDMHKKFSVFVTMDEHGRTGAPVRVTNDSTELDAYLKTLAPGTPIAVEASGGWYWFVDRLEELRDLRGLLRTRLALRDHTTTLKNRIHGALRRYGQYEPGEPRNLFRGKGRVQLSVHVGSLPLETRLATRHELELVDEVERHIEELEKRIRLSIGQLGYVRLLKSLPGVGEILGATIYLEIDVQRFACAEKLASYAGLTPQVFASGGKMRLGRTSPVANHYLKWAFVEAASCIVMHKHRYRDWHVVELYNRLRAAKNHGKATVAVGRHLAEASWWILQKKQSYREPAPASMSSSKNG
jgi:transposase